MQKLLFSADEDKCPYRAQFFPIANFAKVIAEFEQIYESHSSNNLFAIAGKEEITLIAETSAFNFLIEGVFDPREWYDDYESKINEVQNTLEKYNLSVLCRDIICTMIIEEDYSLDQLIQKIALPGQTITIQITDLAFGNTEYSIST